MLSKDTQTSVMARSAATRQSITRSNRHPLDCRALRARNDGFAARQRATLIHDAVACSHQVSICIASSALSPHASSSAMNSAHTLGRSGEPKMSQRRSGVRCAHTTPAGLPLGIAGNAEVIEGAIQQAPQPSRHCMRRYSPALSRAIRLEVSQRPPPIFCTSA